MIGSSSPLTLWNAENSSSCPAQVGLPWLQVGTGLKERQRRLGTCYLSNRVLEACEPDMHSHFLPRRESLLNAALLFFDGEYDQINGSDSSESRI